ncbi:MAG: cupin domain-containing protein [Mycobacterium sp.]
MTSPPILRHLDDLKKFAIGPGDTVQQIYLAGPDDGCAASVFFEVWEPGGSQPPNSHPGSAEVFVILAGQGRAHSDETTVDLAPGDVLVLPEGSVHRIENTSTTERMYAVTVMAADKGAMEGGFAALVKAGLAADLDDIDLNTLFS